MPLSFTKKNYLFVILLNTDLDLGGVIFATVFKSILDQVLPDLAYAARVTQQYQVSFRELDDDLLITDSAGQGC